MVTVFSMLLKKRPAVIPGCVQLFHITTIWEAGPGEGVPTTLGVDRGRTREPADLPLQD